MQRLAPDEQAALEQLAVLPAGVQLRLAGELLGDLGVLAAAERTGLVELRAHTVGFRHELSRRAVESALPAAVRLPTFVLDGNGNLGAVDWVFNGWGAQPWATWDEDTRVASFVAARAGATRILSDLVNEGGGIHVDGLGTVLLTETVQLDPGRNPGLTRADVEAEMARTVGATTCIWLPRGLTRDYDEFGTRGHVDIVATFASPGVVLLHWQGDPGHPDHEVSVELEGLLSSARDARGEPLEVVRVPAPKTLEDDEGPVDWSYINHLVVNGGVVACTFDDPQDDDSLALLERAYEGRRVVGVDARPLFDRGGGIHCITQQQPRV
jgi:agmatine deiminase